MTGPPEQTTADLIDFDDVVSSKDDKKEQKDTDTQAKQYEDSYEDLTEDCKNLSTENNGGEDNSRSPTY